ncbi:MAG TPA: tetratricopeptide repeat protein [Candidatus Kapabacteria bacterium]|nr:tetratricopeptide repeat protein [Candidatus Kapabacteria bacterium]
MRTVRNGNLSAYKNINSTSDYDLLNHKEGIENIEDKKVSDKISSFEKKVLDNKHKIVQEKETISPKMNDENVAENLPSISQQLAQLKSEQDKANTRIDGVEQRLDKIEKILQSMQYDIDRLVDNANQTPMTGANNNESKKKEFTFKPDNSKSSKSEDIENVAEDETFLNEESTQIVKKVKKAPKKKVLKVEAKNQNIIKSNHEVSDISQNVQIQKGITEFRKGNFNESIKLLNIAKSKETSKKTQSEIIFYLAQAYFSIGDYNNSSLNYNNVIQNNNSSYIAESQLKLAESNLRLGKIDDARDAYQKLIASYPESRYVPIARKMLQQL